MDGVSREDRPASNDGVQKLLARFAKRCARREEGGDPQDLEWDHLPNGSSMLEVHEGHLLMSPDAQRSATWHLCMRWNDEYGDRYLLRGSRSAVMQLARRIQRLGPPGGPDFRGQASTWHLVDGESLHALTVGGEYRLMTPTVEYDDGVLVLARNDPQGSVAVLGMGGVRELQAAADDFLRHGCESLQLWIGGRPRLLHALGADGIVGYLEQGDDLFVLGHLGAGEFVLACQSGDVQRELRRYSLEEVVRGDLGSVHEWAGTRPPAVRSQPRTRSAFRDPPRTTAPPRRGAAPALREPARPKRPPHRKRLSGLDLIAALTHLTPSQGWIGEASTVIPDLLEGIRCLVQRYLGNYMLWAKDLRRLIADRTGLRILCCDKIFNAALRIVASRTRLLRRRGRRWLLRLGELREENSKLLRWMIERGRLDEDMRPRRPKRATSGGPEAPSTPARPPDMPAPPSEAVDVATVSTAVSPAEASQPGTHEPPKAESDPANNRSPISQGPETSATSAPTEIPAKPPPADPRSQRMATSSGSRGFSPLEVAAEGSAPPNMPLPISLVPPMLESFEAFGAWWLSQLRAAMRRKPSAQSRRLSSWPHEGVLEDFEVSQDPLPRPGKRRRRPP